MGNELILHSLTQIVTRNSIEKLQQEMAKLPQAEFPTQSFFADEMYCRIVFRPAGATIIGKVHKQEHFYIVCQGTVRVTTENGMKEITGPAVIVSQPGTKRAVYAVTDATCLTVHRLHNNTFDLGEIEEQLIEPDETVMFGPGNKLKHPELNFDVDAYRELTKQVIDNEKVGFWSDYTPEQQEMYLKDDWERFSRSRGYTEQQIEQYRLWRSETERGHSLGFKPLSYVVDLATAAAKKNIALDVNHEIEKTSILHPWLQKMLT